MKYWVFKCDEDIYRLMEDEHEFIGSGNFCGWYTCAYIKGIMYAEYDEKHNVLNKYEEGKQVEFSTSYAYPIGSSIKSYDFEEACRLFKEACT